jgi:hypothetical protein
MTTQTVEAVIANNTMSKVFSKSCTDGQWDGNTLTDTLSTQQLGIIMPNVTVNRVQCRYASGLAAWRIQNAATLTFQRWGFGVPANTACYSSQAIAPYRINPNDIFTVYPLPTDDDAGQANVAAWVQTSKGVELFSAENVQTGLATALTTVVNGQSLGDSMFNSTLQSVLIQVEDGAALTKVEIVDNQGGIVMTLQGGVRGANGGAMSLEYNLEARGLGVALGKGWALKVTTSDS